MTVTTEVVISKARGYVGYTEYLASENLIYCSICDSFTIAGDWEHGEYWQVTGERLLLPVDDTSEVSSILDREVGRTMLHTCPNGCEHTSDPGDEWWYVKADIFVCDGCNEWYEEDPHGAQTCCQGCGEDGPNGDCYCADLVKTDQFGYPELIDAYPIALCLCGSGTCHHYVCLFCHDTWEESIQGLDHVKAHIRNDHEDLTWQFEGQTKPKVGTADGCPICGTYCCVLHKTHAAKHAMCWEARV